MKEKEAVKIIIETKSKRAPGWTEESPVTVWEVLIDAEDEERVKQYSWYINVSKGGSALYARRTVKKPGLNKKSISMHSFVFGKAPQGMQIDHINHNGLDNRKKNLRYVTPAENAANKRCLKPKSSRYKGVSWDKINQTWRAQIKRGRAHTVGHFDNEENAARGYDLCALEFNPDTAHTNFPREEYTDNDRFKEIKGNMRKYPGVDAWPGMSAKEKSDKILNEVKAVIKELKKENPKRGLNHRVIAELNRRGLKTYGGKSWYKKAYANIKHKIDKLEKVEHDR